MQFNQQVFLFCPRISWVLHFNTFLSEATLVCSSVCCRSEYECSSCLLFVMYLFVYFISFLRHHHAFLLPPFINVINWRAHSENKSLAAGNLRIPVWSRGMDSTPTDSARDRLDRVQELSQFTEKCTKQLEELIRRLGLSADYEELRVVSSAASSC